MTTNIDDDPNLIWDKTTKCIKNITKEIQRESKGIELLKKKNLVVERASSNCYQA